MRPILHMGLGWDDFHLRALVDAGFATKDLVLVARTRANTGWAQRNAPDAEVVYLPYEEALKTNPVVGTTVRPALARAAEGAGLDPWDVVLSERALRRRPADVGISFANLAAETLEGVVDGPTIAIAEFTVTSEIVLSGLVAAAGGLQFWPRTLRHPSDRFALLSTPRGITPVPRKHPVDIAQEESDSLLADVVEGRKRPNYFVANSQAEGASEIFRLAKDRVNEFRLEHGKNLQLPQVRDYVHLPWLNVVRGRMNLRHYRTREWDAAPTGRYVLFPFHVQPESSVDVIAPEWRDQVHAAVRLADALEPHGIQLVVKEHQNFIWRRDPSFWEQLDAHRNIAAVDPTSNTTELAVGAEFTFTPTGTAGLEGAVRGQRVVMGAAMPWTVLPNVALVRDGDAMAEFVAGRGWETLAPDRAALRTWWHDVHLANSYPGVALDPPRFPAVMSPENLRGFGEAYAEAASVVEDRSSRPAGSADATA
ncbi:hypothetical protein ACFWH7_05740 [Cellulosimicrobium cellulans]|uniref:hypothetical protein n=1 Tax=Cellulosimicrobium cellulans TaxID=1710 RepID=UPI00365C7327